jgi:hypothetical protein
MKIRKILLVTSVAIPLWTTPLSALSGHTWVSGIGSDSNSGTQTSPYADFATAVANTAPGGIVSVADTGDFGPVTITNSITIDGGGVGGSITFGGDGEGIYIDLSSSGTVSLRHLTINGLGTGSDGIFLASSGPSVTCNLLISDCTVEGFTQIGIGVGDEGPENVIVQDTTIIGGELGFRSFQSSGFVSYLQASLRNVTIQGATSAAIFTRNGFLDVSNSNLTQNLIALENDTSATINAENCMISGNGTGVETFSGAATRLSHNDILDNQTSIANSGGIVLSPGTNLRGGNAGGTIPVASSSLLF